MKKFVTALVLLALILLGGTLHTCKVVRLADDIKALSRTVTDAYTAGRWEDAVVSLEQIHRRWEKDKLWASLTIPTRELEEIEISLNQSIEYAKIADESGFVGEFVMFEMMLEHLPHHEGFDLKEIL